MVDIVLINPRFETSYWGMEHALRLFAKFGKRANMPVSALPLLAALTPAEHKITLIDENVEDIDFALCAKADIVGITGMTVQRFRMTEILKELKERGCFTVIGGPWVSVQEDYFGALANVIFVGEAEETWPQFLADWTERKHAKRYEQAERTDMSKVPPPRYDLLKMNHYVVAPVQFSRGCPFTCEFCDIIVTFGRRPRLKTTPQIIAELETLRRLGGVDAVFIVDDNLIGNKKAIKHILREVIAWQKAHDYPVTFFAEASLDLADDEELLVLMDEANIRSIFVGVETPNEESLRETRKLQNLRGKERSMVEKVHAILAHGIEVWGGMIVGFDHDGSDIFDRQIRFVEQARVIHTSVGMLSAIPKTPLYDRLAGENRLDPADRTPYGTNVIPLGMGRDALREGYLRVLHALYDPKAYFARVDSLFLDGGLSSSAARDAYLRSRPFRRFILYAHAMIYAGFVYFKLQTAVEAADLRHHYRRAFFNVVRRRPDPFVLQAYALKAVMHYHYHTLIATIDADGHLLNMF
ncbi:MAG: B12-binding domain-containing radical SAM protein [Beijerinckiaceae bacterium]|nr:MAG: B12-binding domain-containing radical SAM protein [Beijerinckiaceae bacterium]